MLTTDPGEFGRLAADHLWQSTAFGAAAVLLVFMLKGNRARVRYWVWLAASVKFLIPFSILVSIGGSLGRWRVPAATASLVRLPYLMNQIVQPFAAIQDAALPARPTLPPPATSGLLMPLLLTLWLIGFVTVVLYGCIRLSRAASVVRSSTPITEGRVVEALRRIDSRIEWSRSSRLPRLVSSSAKLEPAAFGIFRPVLCLPAGIADHLDDAELEAILAHELFHIRRRDCLTAVIHMAVEAIFWFHPLVWWLSARLSEERERVCDEEVLRMGGDPQVYAQSILKVCEFYLTSPVACAAGVTGGELKKRIEDIMTNRFGRNLSFGRKLMLAAMAVAALTVPFTSGVISAWAQTRSRNALQFDVASVRLVHNGTGGAWDNFPVNGTWTSKSMEIPAMVAYAYGVPFNRVEGIPKSLQGPDPGFTIMAKMPIKTSREDFLLMLRSLLADRFKAVIHTEVRDVPANTMEVAKGGVKLQPASGECVQVEGSASLPPGQHRCHDIQVRVGMSQDRTITWEYSGWSVAMAELAAKLSNNGLIVDDTGLSGLYDFDVKIATHPGQDDLESQSNWEHDWREAWEKQAGLLIDLAKTKKRPGTVVVVDHVELPTPN